MLFGGIRMNELLINLNRGHTFVYLLSDKNYNSQQMKETAWKGISSEMEMPGN